MAASKKLPVGEENEEGEVSLLRRRKTIVRPSSMVSTVFRLATWQSILSTGVIIKKRMTSLLEATPMPITSNPASAAPKQLDLRAGKKEEALL